MLSRHLTCNPILNESSAAAIKCYSVCVLTFVFVLQDVHKSAALIHGENRCGSVVSS